MGYTTKPSNRYTIPGTFAFRPYYVKDARTEWQCKDWETACDVKRHDALPDARIIDWKGQDRTAECIY